MSPRPVAIHWLSTILFAGVISGIAGHFSAVSDVSAGHPFSYAPPDGFSAIAPPAAAAAANVNADTSVDRVWVEPSMATQLAPRVTLSHTAQQAQMDDASLGAIANGMPAIYEKSHGAWIEERHVVHVRPDGAKVGLIVGNLVTAAGGHLRTMQMVFPDDTGTSIATASFDVVSAPRLVPAFEKSLDTADGIKKFGKKADNWVYIAWFGGATIFALFLQLLVARRPT